MLFLRSLAFNVLFYVTFAVMALVCLPVLALPRRHALGAAKLWARVSLWLLQAVAGIRLDVRGLDRVPPGGDTGLFWPRRTFLRYPGTAVIEFLDPIQPGLARDAFSAEVEARIEAATARLVAEAHGGRQPSALPEPA